MTEKQIRDEVSALLGEHTACGSEPHNLLISKGKISMQHHLTTLDGNARVIKLTAEQTKSGLTPTEWTNLTRKIAKALLDAER